MEERFDGMSRDQLELELKKFRSDLEDAEDTFNFNLTNTSAHLNSGLVAEAEEDLAELRKTVAFLETKMDTR